MRYGVNLFQNQPETARIEDRSVKNDVIPSDAQEKPTELSLMAFRSALLYLLSP